MTKEPKYLLWSEASLSPEWYTATYIKEWDALTRDFAYTLERLVSKEYKGIRILSVRRNDNYFSVLAEGPRVYGYTEILVLSDDSPAKLARRAIRELRMVMELQAIPIMETSNELGI